MSEPEVKTVDDGKIVCHIDGQRTHSIALHIKQNYADTWTLERYKAEFPDAPLMSQFAIDRVEKIKTQRAEENKITAAAGAAFDHRQDGGVTRGLRSRHCAGGAQRFRPADQHPGDGRP